MPRGNKPGNTTKSPIIGDAGVSATPEDLREMTRHALEIFEAQPPDLHDPEAVKAAIYSYFSSCDRHGVRPANLGLYAALGMSKQDVSNVLTGKSKSKVSPDCIDLLKKAKRILSAYREGLAMSGKVNPVTAIFWSKNFDGMEDQTRLEITTDTTRAASMTPEEVQKQIEQDIPLDVDYTESAN